MFGQVALRDWVRKIADSLLQTKYEIGEWSKAIGVLSFASADFFFGFSIHNNFLYIFIVWILMWLNKHTHSTHYIRFMSSWMMRFSRLIKMIFYKINSCLSKVSPLNSLIALTINRIQSIENCFWCCKKCNDDGFPDPVRINYFPQIYWTPSHGFGCFVIVKIFIYEWLRLKYRCNECKAQNTIH